MNEHPATLLPGDRVISLKYLSIECAVLTGGVTAGILLYHAGLSVLTVLAGVAAGGLGGLSAGLILARVLFPTRPGHVYVVRRERSALPLTLRAALVPSIVTALCAVTVIAGVGVSTLGTAVLVGSLVAILVGCAIGTASAIVK